jgi:hypothetical protein
VRLLSQQKHAPGRPPGADATYSRNTVPPGTKENDMLNTRDGAVPRHNGKSFLIGAWFIQREPGGKAVATGRIVRGVGAGEYLLAYTTREPDIAPLIPTATIEQMVNQNFELWAHEANWLRAYTGADAPRYTNGTART